MYTNVQIGQHLCSGFINCTTPPAAGVRNCTRGTTSPPINCAFNGILPALNITVYS